MASHELPAWARPPTAEPFARPGPPQRAHARGAMAANDAGRETGKRRRIDVERSMDFVKRLALDPLLRIPESSQERSDVFALRDLLFDASGGSTQPQQNAGSTAGGGPAKRRRGDGITMRRMTRPCSPTLFTGVKSREEPNDPQADLGETVSLIHKQKFPPQPVDINGPSLRLRTSTLLGPSRARGKSGGRGRQLDVRLAGIQHHNSLGRLVSPLYRPTVEEQWAAREIAIFEAGICAYGKNFHAIQKMVQTKTTREVIDFYYVWKKTDSYKVWKRSYYYPE